MNQILIFIDCKDKNEMLNHFDKVINYEINQIKTNRKSSSNY